MYSILFQSRLNPINISMFSGFAESEQQAYNIGFEKVKQDQGDLMWTPTIINSIEVPEKIAETIKENIQETKVEDKNKLTENWLMSKIVDNKDSALFEASKKYLTSYEVLFIEDKIK